jgi:hypothetical protein
MGHGRIFMNEEESRHAAFFFARAAFFSAAHLFRLAAAIRALPSLLMWYLRRRLPFGVGDRPPLPRNERRTAT